MGRRKLLLRPLPQRRSAAVGTEEDASHRLLQPTDCHENPSDRSALGLGACALSSQLLRLRSGCTLARTLRPGALGADAGWPLPASPAPSGDSVGAAPPTSSIATLPRRGRRLPVGARHDPPRPVWPRASRVSYPMAPLFHPTLGSRSSRSPPAGPEPVLRLAHPREAPPEPGTPCTDRSRRSTPRSREGSRVAGRHWSPGFATRGPASDTLSPSTVFVLR
jgi:hypothetical protein